MTKLEKAAIEWYKSRREWKDNPTEATADKKFRSLKELEKLCKEVVDLPTSGIDGANVVLEDYDLYLSLDSSGDIHLRKYYSGDSVPLKDLLDALSRRSYIQRCSFTRYI